MTDVINNLNTDLKELFVESKMDEVYQILDSESDEIVKEITIYNYEIIKKYFDSEKYTVLFQHIKFVAYSCFLCEYAANRLIVNHTDYESMLSMFTDIDTLINQQS